MARYCVIEGCGRRLRTGTKYCHIHRSEGRYGKKENYSQGGGGILILVVIVGVIFIGMVIQGIIEILKAFGNFIYSNWIIILIVLASIGGFEIWRVSKVGIKEMSKFEKVILMGSIVFTLMLLFAVILI